MITRANILLAIGISLVISFIWILLIVPSNPSITHQNFTALVTSMIALVGAKKEKREARTHPIGDMGPFKLSPSFNGGLYGGLIGGALAGLFFGVIYFLSYQNPNIQVYGSDIQSPSWTIIPHIFTYASFGGIFFGALCHLIILWFCHLANDKRHSDIVFNELSGGIFGGSLAGFALGAYGGWFFGLLPIPFPNTALLSISSGVAAITITMGVVFYNYKGHWREIMRAFFTSIVITVIAGSISVMILSLLEIEAFFPWRATELLVTMGGGILGLVIGAFLGLQVGLTLLFSRLWEPVTA